MKELLELMKCFNGSFINQNFELILYPKTNLYICLNGVETKEDLICKLLEWCSRDCFKSQPFCSDKRNHKYHNEILNGLNKYLHTNFTREDMGIIYQKLGNRINHELTEKFVKNSYDFKVLWSYEE